MAENPSNRPRKIRVLLAGMCVALLVAIWIAGGSIMDWRSRTEAIPWVEVSREEIELRPVITRSPVLVAEGTVDGKNFQLIMRGFTNYFLKETWGAELGQRSFLGGRKPGGYKVTLRTRDFSGQISYGWRGTHSGGGGGRFEEYGDDLLPGRWLWSRNGFVGARADYECHRRIVRGEFSVQEWGEQYMRCTPVEGGLFPTRIAWQMTGRTQGQKWRRDSEIDVVYRVRRFRFETEPSETWFADQVKKYFSRIPPNVVKTNANGTNVPKTVQVSGSD